MNLIISSAVPAHLSAVNAVIEAAKRSLGYDEGYVIAALPLLRIDADYLAQHTCLEASLDDRIIGFAAIEWAKEGAASAHALLDHVWIAPEAQRQGIGKRLVAACVDNARQRRVTRLMIYADPSSEPFYLQLGAARVGAKPSRIVGGPMFPLLALDISSND